MIKPRKKTKAKICALCRDKLGDLETHHCEHFNRTVHVDCFLELGADWECECRDDIEWDKNPVDKRAGWEKKLKRYLATPDHGTWGDPFAGKSFDWSKKSPEEEAKLKIKYEVSAALARFGKRARNACLRIFNSQDQSMIEQLAVELYRVWLIGRKDAKDGIDGRKKRVGRPPSGRAKKRRRTA